MKKFIFIISLITSLYSTTILNIGQREPSDIDNMPSNDVKDTIDIPQDPTPFAQQAEYMTPEEQLDYDTKYNEKFFAPWNLTRMNLDEGEKTWQFMFAKRKMYNRYGNRISKSWFKKQIKNSNFKKYNSIDRPAIIIKHSDIKLYPTNREFYYNVNKAGEGFPFDYNQNSSIYVNTPIFVSHYSLDKQWVYIRASFAFGWVKVKNIAWVTSSFKDKFQMGATAVTTTDNLNLSTQSGKHISLIKLGTIFPMNPETRKYYTARKNKKGYAYLDKLKPKTINIIARKPIKFNHFNIAYIGKQLVGEPYGWGGKLKTRDCSTLTRDFFAPFGIYLPRNSQQQAKSGQYISLKGLSAKEKESAILSYGKPCRSILVLPGHVTIYLGQKNGEPIIMHDYWGARLKNGRKHILGRSVITTTKVGKERADIKKKSMLINSISGLVSF
ncbi:MAG: SH3 domain-containing protein [Sulfurovaceae bacterium]|nr:SH3 domain-containing protein [Sulfurovaceae bacterium]